MNKAMSHAMQLGDEVAIADFFRLSKKMSLNSLTITPVNFCNCPVRDGLYGKSYLRIGRDIKRIKSITNIVNINCVANSRERPMMSKLFATCGGSRVGVVVFPCICHAPIQSCV